MLPRWLQRAVRALGDVAAPGSRRPPRRAWALRSASPAASISVTNASARSRSLKGGHRRPDQRRGAGRTVVGGDHDPEAVVLIETLERRLDATRLPVDRRPELIRAERGGVHESMLSGPRV
jgi:hypothetical protein